MSNPPSRRLWQPPFGPPNGHWCWHFPGSAGSLAGSLRGLLRAGGGVSARSQGDAAARETAHEFFETLLGGNAFATIEREGGRFRSYLLGALKHFMSHCRRHARRLKRGGGREWVSLDEGTDTSPGLSLADEAALAPDRAWAMTLLQRALARVRCACEQEGRGD